MGYEKKVVTEGMRKRQEKAEAAIGSHVHTKD